MGSATHILASLFVVLGAVALAHESTNGDGQVQCEFAKLGRRTIFARHVQALTDAPRTPNRNAFRSPESIVEALHAIYNVDPKLLNHSGLNSSRADKVLTDHFDNPRSGIRLYKAAIREFGSLPAIVEELGLGPPASVRTGRAYIITPQPVRTTRKLRIPERERFESQPESSENVEQAELWAGRLLDQYDRVFYRTFYQSVPEGNVRHTQIIRAMNYLRYLRELEEKAQGGESEAVKKLTERIDRLERAILKIHIGYRMVFRRKFLPRFNLDETVIEEAVDLGLQRAVRKFNPSFGTRFGHYAERWVFTFIHRAIGKKRKDEEEKRANRVPHTLRQVLENRSQTDIHAKVLNIQKKYEENSRRILLLNLYEDQPEPTRKLQRNLEAEVLRRIWGVGRDEAEYAERYTYQQIADILDVDRQRVHQIAVTAERELEIFRKQLEGKYLNYTYSSDEPSFEDDDGEGDE